MFASSHTEWAEPVFLLPRGDMYTEKHAFFSVSGLVAYGPPAFLPNESCFVKSMTYRMKEVVILRNER